ncbi:threonine synthase-like 2 [Carcharodon carcharias]|uniref:threonine synthase-like 2 n=1 Tax=Carcharodon carcharias TaxID=13397 RepID=UPI001B7D98C2|nr:threonine synthase-like 2 [Carcharodon carcharias]
MKYTSTRGELTDVSFEEVIFSGYAPDGGLFMPEEIPSLTLATLRTWSTYSYPQLVEEICSLFISREDLPREDLSDLISQAFQRFQHKDIVELARLKNGLNVLELWHGVTYAFKDLAMSCVGQLLQYFLRKRKKRITIVVGTAGDTGSSAIESIRGMDNMNIIVLLPHGRCSPIQELQMTTVIEDNVHVFAADGTSDELDEPIRNVFTDTEFVKRHNIMSLNSINWARVMVQIAHYFYAYFHCSSSTKETPLPLVEIVVPTGAAGNITAGYIAQMMGLPIRLVAVVNENDIIHRTIQNGDFSLADSIKPSLAPSIDIQEPYNMERIFWLLSEKDSTLIKMIMGEFQKLGKASVPEVLSTKLSQAFSSFTVNDENVIETMLRCWNENQYLLCPHSAVAVTYHYLQSELGTNSTPRCCLATAAAAKFPEAVLKAGLTPEIPPEIRALETMETRCMAMKRGEDWEKILYHKIEEINARRGT